MGEVGETCELWFQAQPMMSHVYTVRLYVVQRTVLQSHFSLSLRKSVRPCIYDETTGSSIHIVIPLAFLVRVELLNIGVTS